VELELRRFAGPLEALINELLARPMPADWRKRLGDHLDLWDDKGFEVAPEHRCVLEDFVEAWGRARGVLPAAVLDETYDPETFAGLGSARGGFDFMLEHLPATLTDKQINEALAHDPRETIPEARPRRAVRVETQEGIGAWYDEAVAGGRYDSSFPDSARRGDRATASSGVTSTSLTIEPQQAKVDGIARQKSRRNIAR
jgi:hypothetical protein